MRRNGRNGEFGDMGILREDAHDATQPEPGAEPIDEMHQFGLMIRSGKTGLDLVLPLEDIGPALGRLVNGESIEDVGATLQ